MMPPPSPVYGPSGERRLHPRVPAPSVDTRGLQGIVCDLSGGGVGVIFNKPVLPETRYEVRFGAGDRAESPAPPHELLMAEVVWCAGVRAGLQWVGVSPEAAEELRQQLRRWLDEGGRWLELSPLG